MRKPSGIISPFIRREGPDGQIPTRDGAPFSRANAVAAMTTDAGDRIADGRGR